METFFFRLIHVYLIVDSVKLGEDDSINESGVGHVRVVRKCLVELGQLIYSLVAHQRLTNKQHQVWLIHLD